MSGNRTDEWLTPPAVIDALGGAEAFDMDPCAPVERPWPTARQHLTVLDNGLLAPWRGRVWLNPPYRYGVLRRWLGRMVDHGRGVALLFARTDTDHFARFVWAEAHALLFLRGRVAFHLVDGSVRRDAGAPSVLCAYGRRDAELLAECGLEGAFMPLRLPRLIVAAAIAETWLAVVMAAMPDGPVRVSDLYLAVVRHPKATRNRDVRAKIRQVFQEGPFERIGRGLWRRQ